MDVLLINAETGLVDNVIVADSVERAAEYFPAALCQERTGPEGPGWLRQADGSFVAPAVQALPAAVRHITKLAFRNRFSAAEKVAIEIACLDNPGAPMPQRAQAAALRASQLDLQASTYIDLDRADTRSGVQALEAAGLLAAGRASAILDAPIAPSEIYPTAGV